MQIIASSLDDALLKVLGSLLHGAQRVSASRGDFYERCGATIVLTNPLARLSTSQLRSTLFSCLGESLWYLAGSDEIAMIEYYVPRYRDHLQIDKAALNTPGAYGPILFGNPATGRQIHRAIAQLKGKPTSRQVVVQIFSNTSLNLCDPPCTCTMQFFVRSGKLNMVVYMRSNDAFKGLTHDAFAFTWIQEMMSRSLGVELGTYTHMAGSLHLYVKDREKAQKYVNGGWRLSKPMPPMPSGDPWANVKWLLEVEKQLRENRLSNYANSQVEGYWIEIAKVLDVHRQIINGERSRLRGVLKELKSGIFNELAGAKVKRVIKNSEAASLALFPEAQPGDEGAA